MLDCTQSMFLTMAASRRGVLSTVISPCPSRSRSSKSGTSFLGTLSSSANNSFYKDLAACTFQIADGAGGTALLTGGLLQPGTAQEPASCPEDWLQIAVLFSNDSYLACSS